MGVLAGYEQKQVYVEDGLWPLINVLARKLGIPVYRLVNEALKSKVNKHLTTAELKTLRAVLRGSHARKIKIHKTRRNAHHSNR